MGKTLNKKDCLRLKVRRLQAWKDVKLKLSRCKEADLKCQFKVQFVGEPAVDEGGPRRELFCLVGRIVSNELMIGQEDKKTFKHNLIALQNRIMGSLCPLFTARLLWSKVLGSRCY